MMFSLCLPLPKNKRKHLCHALLNLLLNRLLTLLSDIIKAKSDNIMSES